MTMADAQVDSPTDNALLQHGPYKILNSQFLIVNHNRSHRGAKQRKRKRLNQVVDKLTTQVSSADLALLNNNLHHFNNNNNNNNNNNTKFDYSSDDETRTLKASKHMLSGEGGSGVGGGGGGSSVSSDGGVSCETADLPATPKDSHPSIGHMFRFDTIERERLLRYGTPSLEEEVEDVFSHSSSSTKSPHSSNTDSPKINLSPLQIKTEPEEPTSSTARPPRHLPNCSCSQCSFRFGGARSHPHFHPISPAVTPMTPISPLPHVYNFEHYLHNKYLPDIFRRRSHSDSDLPLWFEAAKAERENFVYDATQLGRSFAQRPISEPHGPQQHKLKRQKSGQGSLPQESPLDLSTKGARDRAHSIASTTTPLEALLGALPATQLSMVAPQFLPPKSTFSVPVVKGDVASPTTKESVAVRYKLDVSPVVEEMPPGSDVAYVCPVCGQMFSLHDRLAKHMASRHKSRTQSGDAAAKAYLCEVCNRSFARSDMLTRHMRLHTGVKPYTCKVCNQVFSRSDHLSTHQRTHTGEKPYKCPQCHYAACRRDMITRHMRTHTRNDVTAAPTSEHSEESTVPDSPHSPSSGLHSPSTSSSPLETILIKQEKTEP